MARAEEHGLPPKHDGWCLVGDRRDDLDSEPEQEAILHHYDDLLKLLILVVLTMSSSVGVEEVVGDAEDHRSVDRP